MGAVVLAAPAAGTNHRLTQADHGTLRPCPPSDRDAQRMAARSRRHLPEPRHGRGNASPGARPPAGDHRRDRAPAGAVHAPRAGRRARHDDAPIAPARRRRRGRRVRRSRRRGPDVRRQHHHRRQRRPALVPVRHRRRDRRHQPRLRRRRQRGDVRDPHDRAARCARSSCHSPARRATTYVEAIAAGLGDRHAPADRRPPHARVRR